MWITGDSLHPAALRRAVEYGSGYAAPGPMAPGEKEKLYAALAAAGRDPKDFDIMGGIMGHFKGPDDVADPEDGFRQLPAALKAGSTAVVAKPSQFIRHPDELPDFCRRFVERVKALD